MGRATQFNKPLDKGLRIMLGLSEDHQGPIWEDTKMDHRTAIQGGAAEDSPDDVDRRLSSDSASSSQGESTPGKKYNTSVKFADNSHTTENPEDVMSFLQHGWQVFDPLKGDTLCPPKIQGNALERTQYGPLYW